MTLIRIGHPPRLPWHRTAARRLRPLGRAIHITAVITLTAVMAIATLGGFL